VEASSQEVVLLPSTIVSHASNQPSIRTLDDIEEEDEEPADEFTSENALRKL